MNLIITDRCNRSCPYCFAQEKVRLSGGEANTRLMSYTDFLYCLDFLERSGIRQLKLLGGEPTTHPDFSRFVDAGLERKLSVTVFTNGIWSPHVVEYVKQNTSPEVSFLFNVNEPAMQPDSENERQAESLALVGVRGMLGFNIYRVGFDLRFTVGFIEKFGLKREVRLGVAHPIAGQENMYVTDADLPKLGEQVLEQLAFLESHNVLGNLDCGFPLCMFPEEQWGRLVSCSKPGPLSVCNPIIDVGTDLTAWPCFPLSSLLNVSLRDYATRHELVQHYTKKLSSVRDLGFLERCLACKYRLRKQCCGGCVARTVRNWQQNGDPKILEKFR